MMRLSIFFSSAASVKFGDEDMVSFPLIVALFDDIT